MYGTLISSVTVGAGGASGIAFTSIPQTYTDLIVVMSVRDTTAAVNAAMTLNINNTGGDGSMRYLQGSGSAASSSSLADDKFYYANAASATSNTFNNLIAHFPNYTGSTVKTFSLDSVVENNASAGYQIIQAGYSPRTAAITQLNFYANSGTFVQYSTAYLYGLTKGSGGATAA